MSLFGKTYTKLRDEELMELISEGNKRAFDELYKRYANPLIAYFYRLLWKDREKAEDFVHDLFAKIINKPELFDTSRVFKTWIYSVANNMCKNEYKKAEVRKDTSNGLDESYQAKDQNANTLTETHASMFREEFNKKLVELDHKHQEVFEMRHQDGLSIKEIADILEISDGTVKSRLFYATKYLAESLKEYNPIFNR